MFLYLILMRQICDLPQNSLSLVMNDAQLGIQTGNELGQLLKHDDLGGFMMLKNKLFMQ